MRKMVERKMEKKKGEKKIPALWDFGESGWVNSIQPQLQP